MAPIDSSCCTRKTTLTTCAICTLIYDKQLYCSIAFICVGDYFLSLYIFVLTINLSQFVTIYNQWGLLIFCFNVLSKVSIFAFIIPVCTLHVRLQRINKLVYSTFTMKLFPCFMLMANSYRKVMQTFYI